MATLGELEDLATQIGSRIQAFCLVRCKRCARGSFEQLEFVTIIAQQSAPSHKQTDDWQSKMNGFQQTACLASLFYAYVYAYVHVHLDFAVPLGICWQA